MNKAELKKAIKPLVKECIQEVLIEEGLLSNVVTEVVKGLQGNTIVESKGQPIREHPIRERPIKTRSTQKNNSKKINEHRTKLMKSISKDDYNGVDLFEGTEPMRRQETHPAADGATDLGNPNDSGVDISSLMGGATKIWKAMK